jgi:hypothetical protein
MKTGYFNMAKGMILLLTVIVVSSSCKKDRSEDCSVNVSNLSKTYKLAALKYKINASAPEQDYMVFFDDCEKDDHVRLNSNGTYDYIDAGMPCSPPGSDQGTWSVSGNTITSDGLIQGNIESFDCNTLVTVLSNVYTNGDRLIMTLQKQ